MLPDRRTFEPNERDKLLAAEPSETIRGAVANSRDLYRLGLMAQRDYYAIRNIAFAALRRRKRTTGGEG